MELNLKKIKESKTTEELLQFSIINIDKSSGPTSFQNSEFVKKTLKATKTSHLGTLDPKVTGVLPVAINRACKLTGFFLGEDKTYVGILRLHDDIPIEKVQEKINEKFIGEIIQMPPVKSAVKRQLRPRKVYSFNILEKDGKDYLFKVACQGGTYVRTLCVDLGKELGCEGHMLELRRISAGLFYEDDDEYPIVNLYDFEKSVLEYNNGNDSELRKILIPAEIIATQYPIVEIKKESAKFIYHGAPIHKYNLINPKQCNDFEKNTRIVVFVDEKFVGVFRVTNENEEIFARTEFTLQPLTK